MKKSHLRRLLRVKRGNPPISQLRRTMYTSSSHGSQSEFVPVPAYVPVPDLITQRTLKSILTNRNLSQQDHWHATQQPYSGHAHARGHGHDVYSDLGNSPCRSDPELYYML